MLLNNKTLDAIKAGRITVVFRRWKKAGVKAGGTQMTQRGVVGIDSVEVIAENDITKKDVKAAGFASKEELLEYLFDRDDCELYRIGVRYIGEDPRKTLRENADLGEEEITDIIAKLRKLDSGSKRGNWTQLYLQMIHDRPNTHAQILAESIGLDISQGSSRGCES